MHDSESMAFKRSVADLRARRDRHDVSGFQLRIVADRRLALHGYRPEAEKILRLFARQSYWQSGQVRQHLASECDLKLTVPGHDKTSRVIIGLWSLVTDCTIGNGRWLGFCFARVKVDL